MSIQTRKVDSMWVSCSYPRIAHAKAASDTCQAHATTVVIEADGSQMYRCEAHKGFSRDGSERDYSYTVRIRNDR